MCWQVFWLAERVSCRLLTRRRNGIDDERLDACGVGRHTAAGLSENLTRFPFNPSMHGRHGRNQYEAKI